MFCRSLFVFLIFFSWQWYHLLFTVLPLLITSLVAFCIFFLRDPCYIIKYFCLENSLIILIYFFRKQNIPINYHVHYVNVLITYYHITCTNKCRCIITHFDNFSLQSIDIISTKNTASKSDRKYLFTLLQDNGHEWTVASVSYNNKSVTRRVILVWRKHHLII